MRRLMSRLLMRRAARRVCRALFGLADRVAWEKWLLRNSGLFDEKFYLSKYLDIAHANVDPAQHFLEFGAAEWRNPNEWFNTKMYMEINKALLAPGENALVHYIEKGKEMGLLCGENYPSWISRYADVDESMGQAIQARIKQFTYSPGISIVMPVYNSNDRFLRSAIASVQSQLYENWELCIADDCSTLESVRSTLTELSMLDPRIKVVYRSENGHIAQATNSAMSVASGEFIGFLDHDDELSPFALFKVVEILNTTPEADLIYSDEDKIDGEGTHADPYFKPDWNRDLFYSQNYLNHFSVYRRSVLEAIGGLRKGYEGSQDHDMALRYIEKIDERNILHIPHVLYHWRAVAGSTSLDTGEKSYALENGVKALNSHFSRTNQKATAEIVHNFQYRVRWQIPTEEPRVSIIIPFRDNVSLLQVCLEGILNRTTYNNYEILLVDNNSTDPQTLLYLSCVQEHSKIRCIQYPLEFNYSAINNYAVGYAEGEVICLLNNDIDVIHDDWLTEMVSHAIREEVGAVGAKLYYGDDTIQHAGVVLGLYGVAGHVHKLLPRLHLGYAARAALTQNFSAVTGACMVLRKSVFDEMGGLDEENLKVAFNDIDLCIRICEKGYRIVFTPFAELYHYESKSRGSDATPENIKRFEREARYMIDKWGERLVTDPAYNPNLSLTSHNFDLAYPPRVELLIADRVAEKVEA